MTAYEASPINRNRSILTHPRYQTRMLPPELRSGAATWGAWDTCTQTWASEPVRRNEAESIVRASNRRYETHIGAGRGQ